MTTKFEYHTPTSQELYALELQARRLRAEAIAQAFRAGAKAVRALFARPAAAAPGPRTMRHA